MQPRTARDIAERRAEVVRLIGSMRPSLRSAGFDSVDDLAQEVLALILRYEARGMRSRYDPARGAWTTYVVRVTTSLLRDRAISHRVRDAAMARLREQMASPN